MSEQTRPLKYRSIECIDHMGCSLAIATDGDLPHDLIRIRNSYGASTIDLSRQEALMLMETLGEMLMEDTHE